MSSWGGEGDGGDLSLFFAVVGVVHGDILDVTIIM